MSEPDKDSPRFGLVLQSGNPLTLSLGSEGKNTRAPTQNRDNATNKDVNNSELAEDSLIEARFWKAYQDEAKVQDKEFVDDRNLNLDTMLVFAGLFSGILTAFLVGSTALLQQNPADITNALLLNIAQSQWRIETGNANPSAPPVKLPPFEVPPLARGVNCLWYMALMLSLASAMLAMLAKEWLAAFIAYKTRDPYELTRQRQNRYTAFKSWFAITVIDFVPMLLYISLLLFTLGLIFQTWSIDRAVSRIIIFASLVAAALYLYTVLLGSLFEFCPYQARVSAYIRRGAKWIKDKGKFTSWPPINKGACITNEFKCLKLNRGPKVLAKVSASIAVMFTRKKVRDWDSIEWFLEHARDQKNVNAVYRWITGLGLSELSQDIDLKGSSGESSKENTEDYQLKLVDQGDQLLESLRSLCDQQYRDLVYCEGANAARHAFLISKACASMQRYSEGQKQEGQEQDNPDSVGNTIPDKMRELVKNALSALDKFWEKKLPLMTADTNAFLVAAELRITACAIKALPITDSNTASGSPAPPAQTTKSQGHTCLNVPNDQPSGSCETHEGKPKLRIRADRGLCRGGLLLYYHLHHQARMTSSSLDALLSGLSELITGLEKHKPCPLTTTSLDVKMGDTDSKAYLFNHQSFNKRYGLFTGLVSLLDASTTTVALPFSGAKEIKPKILKLTFKLASKIIKQHNYNPRGHWKLLGDEIEKVEPTKDFEANALTIKLLLEITYIVLDWAKAEELSSYALLNACIKALVSRTHRPESLKNLKLGDYSLNEDSLLLKGWVDATNLKVRIDAMNSKGQVDAKAHRSYWGSSYHLSERIIDILDQTAMRTMMLRLLECDQAVSRALQEDSEKGNEDMKRLSAILEAIKLAGADSSYGTILQQLGEYFCSDNKGISVKLLVQFDIFDHLIDITKQHNKYKYHVMRLASSIMQSIPRTSESTTKLLESNDHPSKFKLHRQFLPIANFMLDNFSSNWDAREQRETETNGTSSKRQALDNLVRITGELVPLIKGKDKDNKKAKALKEMLLKIDDVANEVNTNCSEIQNKAKELLNRISGGGGISNASGSGPPPKPVDISASFSGERVYVYVTSLLKAWIGRFRVPAGEV